MFEKKQEVDFRGQISYGLKWKWERVRNKKNTPKKIKKLRG